jgi:hypothetical protein
MSKDRYKFLVLSLVLILSGLFFMFPQIVRADIAFIGSTKKGGTNGGTTPVLNTTGATLLILSVSGWTAPTVSDSYGNTWIGLTEKVDTHGRNRLYYCFPPSNKVGSGHTFTISGSGTLSALVALAFSGAASYEAQNGTTAHAAASIMLPSFTPAQNNELIVTGWGAFYAAASPPIVDSGFTLGSNYISHGDQSTASSDGVAYLIQGIATTVAPTWTWGAGDNAGATIASFVASPTIQSTPPGHSAMHSPNYAIQSDSINFAGGLSTSTSYRMQDTLGEIGTGVSSSTNYVMNAGYQQMLQSYIAISVSSTTAALPDISGLAGGTGTASSTWTVITDNPAGYSLSAKVSTTPALQGDHGDNIADYVPAGAVPDLAFTILPTQSAFGFSPAGVNVVSRYLNNGSICGTGSSSTLNSCWDGFSTTNKIIAQSTAANQPSGATTTTVYEAKIGSSKIQTAGSYSATITVTAVTL